MNKQKEIMRTHVRQTKRETEKERNNEKEGREREVVNKVLYIISIIVL